MLEPIDYAVAYTEHGELLYFYPDGIWDDCKLTLQEAEEKYPKTKYKWIEINE